MSWDFIFKITGLPYRWPTVTAVSLSADKWTCWRCCGFNPSSRILSKNRVAVPWYKNSGGTEGCSCKSTWIECPWLARICWPSSEIMKRFLSLVSTTSWIKFLSISSISFEVEALSISSSILAHPCGSSVRSSLLVCGVAQSLKIYWSAWVDFGKSYILFSLLHIQVS